MRSQSRLAPIRFTLALLLSQLILAPLATAIPNPIDNGRGRKTDLPPAPSTPPPPGDREPGGSLSGEVSVCPVKPQALTAITPINVQGKTLSSHPTFWFYMPYTADEVESGEFSILTQDETQRIYETSFALPDKPGFVSITLPADEAMGLQTGQYYRWYLNVSCASSNEAVTDLNINGWVERVDSESDTGLSSASPSSDIWYDRVDQLVQQLPPSSSPNADGLEQTEQTWVDLLESVELTELTQEDVVGPVMLIDE